MAGRFALPGCCHTLAYAECQPFKERSKVCQGGNSRLLNTSPSKRRKNIWCATPLTSWGVPVAALRWGKARSETERQRRGIYIYKTHANICARKSYLLTLVAGTGTYAQTIVAPLCVNKKERGKKQTRWLSLPILAACRFITANAAACWYPLQEHGVNTCCNITLVIYFFTSWLRVLLRPSACYDV